jgi:hypothetical protein
VSSHAKDRIVRQLALLRRSLSDDRRGDMQVNSLVQRIEGIGAAIDLEAWRERVFPILLNIEQVNAATIESRRQLTADEKKLVDNSLRQLESVIHDFEPDSGKSSSVQ